jgi:hypothetical protein
MKVLAILCQMLAFILIAAATAFATPSTQVRIPSTDVQPFMVAHIDVDNYFRTARRPDGGRDPNTLDIGFRLGVLPYDKVQLEVGFDFLTTATNPNDQHPWSGNIKMATPEDSMFKYSPAIAVGLYNARPVKDIEVRDAPLVTSGQNLVYGLIAKTAPPFGPVPSLGRFSAGYYRGSERALVDNNNVEVAHPRNTGLYLSWDRTITEISDNLWLGVDFMGGDNIDGAISIGVAWRFCKYVSVLFGYNMYQKSNLSGDDTLTTQLDINFP